MSQTIREALQNMRDRKSKTSPGLKLLATPEHPSPPSTRRETTQRCHERDTTHTETIPRKRSRPTNSGNECDAVRMERAALDDASGPPLFDSTLAEEHIAEATASLSRNPPEPPWDVLRRQMGWCPIEGESIRIHIIRAGGEVNLYQEMVIRAMVGVEGGKKRESTSTARGCILRLPRGSGNTYCALLFCEVQRRIRTEGSSGPPPHATTLFVVQNAQECRTTASILTHTLRRPPSSIRIEDTNPDRVWPAPHETFVITTYKCIARMRKSHAKWDRVVFDDAHVLDHDSSLWTAARRITATKRWIVGGMWGAIPESLSQADLRDICAILAEPPFDDTAWWDDNFLGRRAIHQWFLTHTVYLPEFAEEEEGNEKEVTECRMATTHLPLLLHEQLLYEALLRWNARHYARQFAHSAPQAGGTWDYGDTESLIQMLTTSVDCHLRGACVHPFVALGDAATGIEAILNGEPYQFTSTTEETEWDRTRISRGGGRPDPAPQSRLPSSIIATPLPSLPKELSGLIVPHFQGSVAPAPWSEEVRAHEKDFKERGAMLADQSLQHLLADFGFTWTSDLLASSKFAHVLRRITHPLSSNTRFAVVSTFKRALHILDAYIRRILHRTAECKRATYTLVHLPAHTPRCDASEQSIRTADVVICLEPPPTKLHEALLKGLMRTPSLTRRSTGPHQPPQLEVLVAMNTLEEFVPEDRRLMATQRKARWKGMYNDIEYATGRMVLREAERGASDGLSHLSMWRMMRLQRLRQTFLRELRRLGYTPIIRSVIRAWGTVAPDQMGSVPPVPKTQIAGVGLSRWVRKIPRGNQ